MNSWAVAEQDAGPTAAAVAQAGAVELPQQTSTAAGWLERLLHFGLLQPVAHWVLASVAIAWWTWPGLVQLTTLLCLNSLVVSIVAIAILRTWCRRVEA